MYMDELCFYVNCVLFLVYKGVHDLQGLFNFTDTFNYVI
jgi:hypothetical protein